MQIERERYLNKLISFKDNEMVKVITGIRRCGKTYLLFVLYYNYLISNGVDKENIIRVSLDESTNEYLRDYDNFENYLKNEINKRNGKKCYIFIDEIQMLKPKVSKYTNELLTFHFILIEHMKKADIYVTGSNSKMLSSDIITEFRGRANQIKLFPLSFKEFYKSKKMNSSKEQLFKEYFKFGGLPHIANINNEENKWEYLEQLFDEVYYKDILERHSLKNDKDVINRILDLLSSNVGSLTNPLKISNTLNSTYQIKIATKTVQKYLDILEDSFLIHKVHRYDIKGKKILNTPYKYYFADLGLRNARSGILQSQQYGHIYENIIYNELIYRGYRVNVGIIESFTKDKNNKTERKYYEIDFIAEKHNERYFIQSSYDIESEETYSRETRAFELINEGFKRIIIVNNSITNSYDRNGNIIISIIDFLLDENLIKQ